MISNVPGPRTSLYCAGAELLSNFPVSVIVDGVGLNITVVSYKNRVDFGIVGDREQIDDAWAFLEGAAHALPRAGRDRREEVAMPVQPPNRQQLEWIADTLHMQLTEEELDVFEAAIGPSLDELPAPGRAARRAAPGQVSAGGPRAPAGGRREPEQRLGVEVLDPAAPPRGRWPAARSA